MLPPPTIAAFVHATGRITSSNGITNWLTDIPRPAFDTLNEVRKIQGKPLYSFADFQQKPWVNRDYATEYLRWLYGTLTQDLNRAPTTDELFWCFKLGLAKFRKLKHDWSGVKDKESLAQFRIFRVLVTNPKLVEELLPPLSVPLTPARSTGREVPVPRRGGAIPPLR